MLLDTNIVIELFKGNLRVSAFLREQNVLSICSVSVMELYYVKDFRYIAGLELVTI